MSVKEAIALIQETAVEATTPDRLLLDVGGTLYMPGYLGLEPVRAPRPLPLEVHSLGAVLAYLAGNRDGLDLAGITVHVVDPFRVDVIGPVSTQDGGRTPHLRAEPVVADALGGWLNRPMPISQFVVGLQAMFGPEEDRDAVLAVVGNITDEDVRTLADDGVSQRVTVQAGVRKSGAVIKNPVRLRPLRSFPEVVLDPVEYVLRLHPAEGLPRVSLNEADGGAWRLDAMGKIAAWLDQNARVDRSGDQPKVVTYEWGLLA